MSKYTKTVKNTPPEDRTGALKSLKTSIHKHTGFGNIDDPSKSLPIDPDKAAGYSPRVVSLARQLKYQHEQDFTPSGDRTQRFSDEYYLDYAKRQLDSQFDSAYDKILGGIDVAPDPAYAQYSYEEIIAMANNGVNIPKAVLAWAKGQQEADVVDYIVVSDNAEYSDEHAQDKDNGESEINKIRAEVKDNAIKSKKAQEDITINKDKTAELTNKATDIANEQKNLFNNNSIDKTEQMVKEWKELDKKKNDEGKLSASDDAKYKKLGEKLQKNGEIIRDMKVKSSSLDSFLESIDGLNNEVNEGLATAQKTINSASSLSDLDDRLNTFVKVHAYKIADKSSGMLEDTLSNISDIQLAFVSDKIGHDLEDLGNEISAQITDDGTQEVVKFANTYVNKANHIESVLGIKDEDEQENNTQSEDSFEGSNTLAKGLNDMFEDNEDSNDSNPFGFLFSFMSNPEVAAMFTAGTLLSNGITLAESTVLNAESVVLGALANKEKKEDEKLQKAADENVEKFSANSEKIVENEDKITQLDEQAKIKNAVAEGQPVEAQNEEEVQNKIENKQSDVQSGNSEIESQKAPIVTENEILQGENSTLADKVQKPLDNSAKALSKTGKYLKNIDANNQTLKADTKELEKLADNTAQIAAENLKAGMTNLAICLGLYSAGGAMLPNIATHSMGLFLIKTAAAWDIVGSTQIVGGTVATAGAMTGIASAEIANLQNEVTNTIVKSVVGANKESKILITETSKAMGGLEVPEDAQNTVQQTENKDEEDNSAPLAEGIDNSKSDSNEEVPNNSKTEIQNQEPLNAPVAGTKDEKPEIVSNTVSGANAEIPAPMRAATRTAAPEFGAIQKEKDDEKESAPESEVAVEKSDNESKVENAPAFSLAATEDEILTGFASAVEEENSAPARAMTRAAVPEVEDVEESEETEEVANTPEVENVEEPEETEEAANAPEVENVEESEETEEAANAPEVEDIEESEETEEAANAPEVEDIEESEETEEAANAPEVEDVEESEETEEVENAPEVENVEEPEETEEAANAPEVEDIEESEETEEVANAPEVEDVEESEETEEVENTPEVENVEESEETEEAANAPEVENVEEPEETEEAANAPEVEDVEESEETEEAANAPEVEDVEESEETEEAANAPEVEDVEESEETEEAANAPEVENVEESEETEEAANAPEVEDVEESEETEEVANAPEVEDVEESEETEEAANAPEVEDVEEPEETEEAANAPEVEDVEESEETEEVENAPEVENVEEPEETEEVANAPEVENVEESEEAEEVANAPEVEDVEESEETEEVANTPEVEDVEESEETEEAANAPEVEDVEESEETEEVANAPEVEDVEESEETEEAANAPEVEDVEESEETEEVANAPEVEDVEESEETEEVANAPEVEDIEESEETEEVENTPEVEDVEESEETEEVANAPEVEDVEEPEETEEAANAPEVENVEESEETEEVANAPEVEDIEEPEEGTLTATASDEENTDETAYAPARAMARAAAVQVNNEEDNNDLNVISETNNNANSVENINNSGEEFSQNPSQDENQSGSLANSQTEPEAETAEQKTEPVVEPEPVVTSKTEEVITSDDDVKDYVRNAVAMGKQPQDIISSFSNLTKGTVDFSYNTTQTSNTNNTTKTEKSENNEQKVQQEEKISDPQAELKSAFGSNVDFVALTAIGSITALVGLGPTTFTFEIIRTAAIVALSVLDLFAKDGVVGQSEELAGKDVNSSTDAAKSLVAKSNEIKAQHDKNVAQAMAYTNDFKVLNDESINYQFEMMQNQAKLVEAGRMSPDEVTEFADPNDGAKNAIYAQVSGISAKDSKLLSTIGEPTSKSEKALKISQKSVQGFKDLNGKLSERNENNDKVGDLIIGESIVAQGLITALIATLLACGPWCWGLVGLWAVALAENAAFAAAGVGAKLASDKVDGSIDGNNQSAADDGKAMAATQKQMLDVRKVMASAKLDKMGNLPPQAEAQQASEQNQDKAQANENDENANTNNQNAPQNDNVIRLTSFARNESETRSGFGKSSLNAELDINNPNDVKRANEYAIAFTRDVHQADEKSKAAASTNANASSQNDTTTKAEVKLSRFNKDGAIDSSKRAKKVNAASASHNGRKRR